MRSEFTRTVDGKTQKRVKIIDAYYNELQPDMNYKDFELICKTPFIHVKKRIANDELFEIFFKFLGKFYPAPSKIVWMLRHNQSRFDKELVTQSTYARTLIVLTTYISKNVKIFESYKKEISQWIKI
jgi:ribosomal protein S18